MLGTEQYGIYSVFFSWVSIVGCFLGLGVYNSIGTGQYQFKNSYYEFKSSLLLLSFTISFVMISIISITPISKILGYTKEWIVLLCVISFSELTIKFIQTSYIYEKKADKNVKFSILISVLSVVISMILIPFFPSDKKYLGRIYGIAIPYIMISGAMWIPIFMKSPPKICCRYCKYAIFFGIPMVFHSLAQNILAQSDRVMMQKYDIPNSEIGIYSLFYTLSSVLSIILISLNNSWCPFYYDDLNLKEYGRLKIKCRNYMELFTVITFGFLMLSREVSYILANKEYWSGINIIPIIVLSVYFTFMYQFPVNFEFFHKKAQIIAVGTFVAAGINIILNIIMIPVWRMYGAAISTTISYGILFFVHHIIVSSFKNVTYHLSLRNFVPGLIIVLCGIGIYYVLADFWIIRWLIGGFIGVFELKRIFRRKTIF